MRRRRLGASDLWVSEIGLGSWLTYGWLLDPKQSEACVRHAIERGVNFFDTANSYAQGAVESFLGDVLRSVPRESYVLATKVYFPMGPADRGLSRRQINKQLEASLRRLRTEYIDLYQCHRFDEETPIEETTDALAEAMRSGKVRYVGFSEWTPAQILKALARSDVVRFISSQPQYSILWRAPEADVLPLCQANGIGSVVWSPLAQGVLTGKYQPGHPPPSDSRAARHAMSNSPARALLDRCFLSDQVLSAVQRLRPIAEHAGLTLAQLALSWVLRQSTVASAIIGATRPEQLQENCGATGVVLDADVLQAIDEVTRKVAWQ